jgi:hypothetical protein
VVLVKNQEQLDRAIDHVRGMGEKGICTSIYR